MPAVGGPFHDIGYEKVRMHREVQKVLEEFYQDDRASWMDEYVPGDFITCASCGQPTIIKRIDQPIIREKIDLVMRPILEQWSGIKLAKVRTIATPVSLQFFFCTKFKTVLLVA